MAQLPATSTFILLVVQLPLMVLLMPPTELKTSWLRHICTLFRQGNSSKERESKGGIDAISQNTWCEFIWNTVSEKAEFLLEEVQRRTSRKMIRALKSHFIKGKSPWSNAQRGLAAEWEKNRLGDQKNIILKEMTTTEAADDGTERVPEMVKDYAWRLINLLPVLCSSN